MEIHMQAATIIVAAGLLCAVPAWAERGRWRNQGVRSAFRGIVRDLGMDPRAMRLTAGGGTHIDAQGRTWGTGTHSMPDDEYEMYRMELRDDGFNLVNAWTKGGHLTITVRGIPDTVVSRLDGRPLSALIGPETDTKDLRIVEATKDKDGFVKVKARRR